MKPSHPNVSAQREGRETRGCCARKLRRRHVSRSAASGAATGRRYPSKPFQKNTTRRALASQNPVIPSAFVCLESSRRKRDFSDSVCDQLILTAKNFFLTDKIQQVS